jgi:hypothetical protein
MVTLIERPQSRGIAAGGGAKLDGSKGFDGGPSLQV